MTARKQASLTQRVAAGAAAAALVCCAIAVAAEPAPRVTPDEPRLGWWRTYHTVATDPKRMDLETVGPMAVRSAGYHGGWYGYWYLDNQQHVSSYSRDTWARMGQAGAKRLFYFDSGEFGDFAAFLDDEGAMVHNAWTFPAWPGRPALEARWFGLASFMADADWAPFPTASDYELPPFTYPGGAAAPTSELYGVLARKGVDGQYAESVTRDPGITDEQARASGLDEISSRTGDGWAVVRLWANDAANPQLTAFRAGELTRMIRRLDEPAGVHIDNFGANNLWLPAQGAFGDWSVHRFREFLSRRHSVEELEALGVASLDSFDMREYVRNRGLPYDDAAWADDPLWSAYKVFKAKAGLEGARALYEAAKAAGAAEGLDFAVCGNVIPLWPGAGLMRGSVDIASFEWLVDGAYPGFSSPGLPPELRAGYVTRLGARISNAPYCWPELYVTYDPRRPNDASGRYFGPGHENLHKVMAFDCFANRGLLDHAYWYQHKRSPGTDESAGFVNAFIEGLPSALSRREYAADIGLVFNPWCDVAESTVAGMRHEAFLEAYSGWADFLTLEHDQWRVVLAGELCEMDLDSLAVLLLPSVTVLNDAQMAAIRAYASSGGRVVATGGTGTRGGPEGYFARRDEPLEGIARVRRTRAQPGRLFRRQGRASELRAQMSRLLKFEDVTWSVETQGPETVGVNLSVILDPPKDPVFTLDLNNYDVDRDTDRLSPAPAIPVTLRPPDGLRFDPSAAPRYVMANAGAPFIEKALPAEGYSVSEGGRRATLELPPFDYYMMVIWSGVS